LLVNKSKSAWARKEAGKVLFTINDVDAAAKVLGTDFSEIINSGIVINNNNSGSFVSNGMNPTLNLQLTDNQFKEFSSIFKDKNTK